jgi:phosphonate transport system ATP-binding protein
MSERKGIHIESLRKVWPDKTVGLDNVSLTVPPGQFVAILGRSGAGKSTLLRTAARLIDPTSGRVHIGNLEVTAARGSALSKARGSVGFVFQQFNLVRSYTALENVLVARVGHVSWLRGFLGLWTPRDREIALKSLADVGIAEKADNLARELSGGQQQRVAVARAFAQQPSAIFADEPTASLDPHLAAVVLELLREYGRTHQVPVLVNVHTLEHARKYADRIVGMQRGKIIHDIPVASLTDDIVASIYDTPTTQGATS